MKKNGSWIKTSYFMRNKEFEVSILFLKDESSPMNSVPAYTTKKTNMKPTAYDTRKIKKVAFLHASDLK